MKKRFLRIIFLILITGSVFAVNQGWEKITRSQTVEAFGDLIVDFHVPVGNPIFSLFNLKPADSQLRPIDVNNNGSVPRFIAARGIKTGGSAGDPKIESALLVTIKDGVTPVYGPHTMADFFSQSSTTQGVPLGLLNNGQSRIYNFAVEFPAGAGNEYQGKSVTADIKFGIIISQNVVINEVFYNAEPKSQWIELYNPTDQSISLKEWSISDNGDTSKINANKKIAAGGYALLSKDASVWRLWNENQAAQKVETGKNIGNGLSQSGDRLILKNSSGNVIDSLSWGSDTSLSNPSVPSVTGGQSIERLAPGYDTDLSPDWVVRLSPSPGI